MHMKPQNRDEVISLVLRLGFYDTIGERIVASNVYVQCHYMTHKPSNIDFANYLRESYTFGFGATLDHHLPFIPYDFHYDNAGLHFRYRDDNQIIHLECLDWQTVASGIRVLILQDKYKVCEDEIKLFEIYTLDPYKALELFDLGFPVYLAPYHDDMYLAKNRNEIINFDKGLYAIEQSKCPEIIGYGDLPVIGRIDFLTERGMPYKANLYRDEKIFETAIKNHSTVGQPMCITKIKNKKKPSEIKREINHSFSRQKKDRGDAR